MDGIIPSNEFFAVMILGNSVFEWIIALAVFFAVFIVLKLFQVIFLSRMKKLFLKTKTELDDVIINSIDAIYWPFYLFAAIYIALQFVNTPEVVSKISFNIFLIIIAYYAVKFVAELIDFGSQSIIRQREEDQQQAGIVKLVSFVLKIVLWVGALILILANMGYNVTSLIAGLGVGGIAIGLALQNILGDLFSSLAIYFDKPFKIGDFIIIGNQAGTVTKVGIKTTRLQTSQGEELVVSNSELTTAQLRNFGVMERRRSLQHIGVTYDTSAEVLRKIPDMLEEIVIKQEKVEFDRVHMNSFGDSALVYELVFFVNSDDYKEFLGIQQDINFDIVEKFNSEGIEFAFPSQTVYLKKD